MLKKPPGYTIGDAHAETMIKIYRDAERQLTVLAQQTLASGALGSNAYVQRQLAIARLIITQLQTDSTPRVYMGVSKIYQAAGKAAFEAGELGGTFNGVNQRAVLLLAAQMDAKVKGAIALLGRNVDDAFRSASLAEVAQGVVGGASRVQVSRALEKRLIEEKITDATTGFVDRAGRRWSLESYTRMVARTTTREAMSAAVAEQVREADGDDLVTVSDHGDTSDLCGDYAGNTYSLEGKTPGYDVLPDSPPFHPNCVHVLTPAAANFDAFEQALHDELLALGRKPALAAA